MDVRLRAQLTQALKASASEKVNVLKKAFRCLCASSGQDSSASSDLFVLCAETALTVCVLCVCVCGSQAEERERQRERERERERERSKEIEGECVCVRERERLEIIGCVHI